MVGDQLAGVLVALGGHPVAMLWAGGCFHRFDDLSPNVLLHRHVLEWALEQGCRAIDLAGVVDEGVTRFKLAFGGTRVPYLAAESFLLPEGLRRVSRPVRTIRGAPARS